MAEGAAHEHFIDTGKGKLNLEDLGRILPGMAEVMPLVGERVWKCYYAGKARNGLLARFQLKEAVNLLRKGVILRPKYSPDMDKFIAKDIEPVRRCIASEDWEGFEEAFDRMVESANAYHEVYGKGFLRWKVPASPPPDLDMTPRD